MIPDHTPDPVCVQTYCVIDPMSTVQVWSRYKPKVMSADSKHVPTTLMHRMLQQPLSTFMLPCLPPQALLPLEAGMSDYPAPDRPQHSRALVSHCHAPGRPASAFAYISSECTLRACCPSPASCSCVPRTSLGRLIHFTACKSATRVSQPPAEDHLGMAC